ncbi:MAG: zinc ABC transporter substrate-binding protein [Hydrogenothermaceae bacterium]
MKNILFIILAVFIGFNFAKAELKIVTTYPYIASITKEVVKDKASVEYLAEGNVDPHFIVPKPSLSVKLRNADLLIINGASLEIGWLPPLINQASNPKINPSSSGFLDLSQFINLIEKHENVSRALGDVHPEGNPHFHLDPYNIPVISDVITKNAKHIENLINSAQSQGLDYILQDVYHSQKPAKFLAEKTGVKMVVLPHDVWGYSGGKRHIRTF